MTHLSLLRRGAVSAVVLGLALVAVPEAQQQRASPHETVSAEVAGAKVSITYGRPYMKGRQVVGGLIPFERVWRTGADEATTLKTDKALKFGTLSVPAGTYTIYTIPTGGTWHLIVSKKTGQWGVPYPKGEDLGRVPMTVGKAPAAAEQLTISVQDTPAGATLHIDWGTTRASVPFTIG